jgi:two-component system chemotaxis response regulator CheB
LVPSKRIVVIGASSGGIEALRSLVAELPGDFAAPICVVLHVAPESPAVLADILSRSGPVPAATVRDREPLRAGRIYVPAPDFHLVIEPGVVRVAKGPRENRFRPAIDPLFRTAAQVYGPGAVGVVLTGNLDDGTGGLWTIKQLGGIAVVQDPTDAMFPSMPASAINHVRVDHVLPLSEIPDLLVRVATEPVNAALAGTAPESLEVEVKIAKEHNALQAGLQRIGEPSSFACPECHGVLLKLRDGRLLRFRCHTGHAYSVDSLLSAIGEGIEDTLWNAIRALEEAGMLLNTMIQHLETSHEAKDRDEVQHLRARADEAHRQSEALRKLVSERETLPTES